MIAAFYKVNVKPGKMDELVEYLEWDGQVARDNEPGTLRFDVYPAPEDENALYVYEAYVDEAAFEEHKKGEPFQKFAGGFKEECIASMEGVIPAWTTAVWPVAE